MTDRTGARPLIAETVGTLFLLATVVGSGIMAEELAAGSAALALLGNTLATGAILVVLIFVFAPFSGAHFNPAVTISFALRGELDAASACAYIGAQLAGAILGVWLAHAMFDLDILQSSARARSSAGIWLSEAVATFGLVLTILCTLRWGARTVAAAVGLYISAGYWFTASTSFANPAVTVARAATDTFSGIRPPDVGPFVLAQLAGAILATLLASWLLRGASATD